LSTGYALAYRFGLTPWEKAGRDAAAQFNALLDREQDGGPSFGRALDIGCGTGDHAVNLARRGWDVTAVDFVPRALDVGRAKAVEGGRPVGALDVGPSPGNRDQRLFLPTGERFVSTPSVTTGCASAIAVMSVLWLALAGRARRGDGRTVQGRAPGATGAYEVTSTSVCHVVLSPDRRIGSKAAASRRGLADSGRAGERVGGFNIRD